jgi:hypothetical protein
MRTRHLVALATAVMALLAAGAANAASPTFFTTHISRDLSTLPPAPSGPCEFAVGRHVDLDLREIFFPDSSGNIVRQLVLTPDATETFTNLSNDNQVTLRTPSSQHYTYNADGSIDVATTGLGFIVTAQGGVLALDTGRHVLHLVPIYDDSGNLVSYDVSSTFDAGSQDPLFPALCEALA